MKRKSAGETKRNESEARSGDGEESSLPPCLLSCRLRPGAGLPAPSGSPYLPGGPHVRHADPQPHQGPPPRPRRRPGAAQVELPHPPRAPAQCPAGSLFAGPLRNLLAYERPDGWLKPLDGHLRRELDPDMEVEVLDVREDEARLLLLSLDPLALLAQTQDQQRDRLGELRAPGFW